MALHPGPEKCRVSAATAAVLDPIQRALHENEDWYQDLVEHSHDLLCIHDLEGRLLSVNPAPARVLGYSVEELLQIPMRDLVPPEFRAQFDAYLSQMASVGESHGLMTVMARSGEWRIWEYRNTLRTEGVASPIVRGIAHDVTEQKRAEKLLRQASELNRHIIASSSEGIVVYDRNLCCVTWNPFMERLTGIATSAALGKSYQELVPPEISRHDPGAALKQALAGDTITTPDEKLYGSGDRARWVSIRKDPLRTPQGEITGVIVTLQDITERKQAEARLAASENRYRAVHDRSPVGICWIETPTGRFLEVNRKYCEIAGRTEQDLLSRDFQSITHPDDLAENCKKMQRLATGEVRHFETEKRYVRPDGSIRWVEVAVVAMGPEGEIPSWHMAIVEDVTERKRAEEALRNAKEFSENLIRTANVIILSLDTAGNITLFNHAAEEITGYTFEELRGKSWSTLVPRDRFPHVWDEFDRVVAGTAGPTFENPIVAKTGEERYIAWRNNQVKVNGTVVATISFGNDITERKQAEQALHQNMAQLREVTEELRQAKERLSEEKLLLEQAIDTELGFGEIIGRSNALKEVMQKVVKVARCDATVLLLGETGTGKELVARALHRLSTRQENSFIKLNCAAIPSGLLESELFGYEKGAFTSSVARKLGRIELADRGTLFLDEIGEIPLSLQPKLLRVLQDQEFERLGGTQTLKVNFRLLTATNRDLLQSVQAHEFRSDLYYRLNVFPILIPPLRERREDIRPLVEHFVRKFASQMKKSITSIPSKTMEMLVRWEWPGNIRELENFVERSVILTPGSVLQAPLAELQSAVDEGSGGIDITLRTRERERLLRALRDCHGRIGGPDGAAARLGLKRTTLQSKLDHLGIKPGSYRS